MIISQLSTCEECRDGSCPTCKRFKRRQAVARKRNSLAFWAKHGPCHCGRPALCFVNQVAMCARCARFEVK